MKTLVLFRKDTQLRAAMLDHYEDFDTCDDRNIYNIDTELKADDNSLIFVETFLADTGAVEEPIVTDNMGDEAPMQRLTM